MAFAAISFVMMYRESEGTGKKKKTFSTFMQDQSPTRDIRGALKEPGKGGKKEGLGEVDN